MLRDNLSRSFKRLGLQPKDYKVLKLFPLIYVGWADGKMEQIERERIESFASRHYDLSASGFALLEKWLDRAPKRAYVEEALRDIYLLAEARDDMEVDFSELPGLLAYAEGIARTTAHALDQPTSVTAEEEAALEELGRALHIDHGWSWARLLADLEQPSVLS